MRSRRDDQAGEAAAGTGVCHREGPSDRARGTVEAHLSNYRDIAQPLGGHLAGGREQRGGQSKVEARARLAQVRRSQVDGDSLEGELPAGVDEGGPDALARLPHGGIRQADDGEGRQAWPHVGLDRHLHRFDAVHGICGCTREHAPRLGRLDIRGARWMSQISFASVPNRPHAEPAHNRCEVVASVSHPRGARP